MNSTSITEVENLSEGISSGIPLCIKLCFLMRLRSMAYVYPGVLIELPSPLYMELLILGSSIFCAYLLRYCFSPHVDYQDRKVIALQPLFLNL